ncbi:MAG: 1-deoxy-D-xylulose-5-phosphate reductoisomerase [Acidobacteria bacterium]|nr:1-deoxy-D-xylulose-5-phosphate reductoisomerase [Acidobacteriota bacterium]
MTASGGPLRVAILGSTGSIGQSALAVAEAHPERVVITGLAAGRNVSRAIAQVAQWRPRAVSMGTAEAIATVRDALDPASRSGVRVWRHGGAGLIEVATQPDVDIVLCASSGTAALEAVLAAIACGKTIALANKEVLVMAGELVMAAAARNGVAVLPVDSEHNAVHQCLHGRSSDEITRIILTASGGPFRLREAASLDDVTPDDALSHPTWKMGRKITIDSATLMNKGLEVIEARWLFDVEADRIHVVVHPQSVVHSLVELRDGSVMAQLGVTDMRLPIQYAFSYPDRWAAALPSLSLTACRALEFFEPDHGRFPCLPLAFAALRAGSSHCVVLNGANEVAVAAFLDRHIRFPHIARLIEEALDAHAAGAATRPRDLADIRAIDAWAQAFARERVTVAR